MDINEIKERLIEDQKAGYGEILKEKEDSILYYDYGLCTGAEMIFRADTACTKETLMELIITDDAVWTKEKTADVIIAAYKDMLPDAICTVRSIILIHDTEDIGTIYEGLFKNAEPWGIEGIIDDNEIGKNIYDWQVPIIHLGNIRRHSDDDEMYMDGVGCTIIHELRHCMLDCNPILPEEKYPKELGAEDSVESFCRERWDHIRHDFI